MAGYWRPDRGAWHGHVALAVRNQHAPVSLRERLAFRQNISSRRTRATEAGAPLPRASPSLFSLPGRVYLEWRVSCPNWRVLVVSFACTWIWTVCVSCIQLYERAVKSVWSKAGKATQSGRLEEINDDEMIKWKCQTFCVWPDLWRHRWTRGQIFQLHLKDLVQGSPLPVEFSATSIGYRDR